METTTLNIAHFNDVYQVSEHKVNGERIDVSKFATLLEGVTSKWSDRGDGRKDGLTVFSGDLFSPSIESSITRGKHMLPIINELNVDIAVAGNHEFDFGIRNCKSYSPSLLSHGFSATLSIPQLGRPLNRSKNSMSSSGRVFALALLV
ncbi:flagellar associated protein [Coprinopsis cinerea AmutBmut pab1-1]|nr:flagellar associated protein [Coprinopsis cinerea AmutBmut pab1-1]